MKKLAIGVLLFVASVPMFASVAHIQVTASGTATGACTGSGVTILTPTQFSNSSNWGSGSTQIGPDTVILACGTFTGTTGQSGLLDFMASGTSGHPIVFTCDAGTNITSPQWHGGSDAPINMGNLSYITLNGAGCTIQNTANGSGLANNTYSTGIWVSNGSNVTVENFTISNICQHTSATDHNGCSASGNLPAAIITDGSNITVQGNTIHDSAYGVYHNAGTSDTGLVISGNTIDRCNQHIAIGVSSSAQAISGAKVFGNTLTNAVNWDDGVTDTFHHNGIFVFQGTGGAISNTLIYNNTISGDFGVNDTSYIFIDDNGGTITGTKVFNNLLLNGSTTNGPANGFITALGTSTGAAYNNTIFCNGVGQSAIKASGPGADTLENNIISTCPVGIYVNSGSTIAGSNYNVIYDLTGGSSSMYYNGTNYSTVAAWTAGTGFDANSVTGNPKLNTDGTLQSGSSAIAAATNLTSLSITALNSDYAGNPRPSSGAWDVGAYEGSGGTPTASTPTFSPVAGTYTGTQTVTISASTGGVICYNTTGSPATNGTTGCTTGTHYTVPVSVAASETLYAVAGGTGYLDSTVGSAPYVILTGAATPTFSPVAGTYSSTQTVTISTSSGTVICYNTTGSPATNGTTGCTTGTHYTSPVSVSSSKTLYAVAGGTGLADSSVGSAAYTIAAPAAPIGLTGTVSLTGAIQLSGQSRIYNYDIQNQSGWVAAHDAGTSGTSSGTMAVVSSPSLSGNARQFNTTFTSGGGERYDIPFATDAAATNFMFDAWVYVASGGTAINALELDTNQVIPDGDTVIYGIQCDSGTGKWDYTQNTGTPSAYVDVWTASSVSCNPTTWSTNTWHHVQFTYSRDSVGNVTYQTIAFDGVSSTLNVTVLSAFTLGWSAGALVANFQMDGLGSGSNVLYLDSFTISRW